MVASTWILIAKRISDRNNLFTQWQKKAASILASTSECHFYKRHHTFHTNWTSSIKLTVFPQSFAVKERLFVQLNIFIVKMFMQLYPQHSRINFHVNGQRAPWVNFFLLLEGKPSLSSSCSGTLPLHHRVQTM